jgi:hypothetical protein
MNSLQQFISNLKISKFSAIEGRNHSIKKKCPQHLKNFDERSLKILNDHEEAVFKHMLMRYLKKEKCEKFYGN